MTTPHCDISTGKIYGCKKGSFSWWHEKGHLLFNQSDKGSQLHLYQNYIFYFWMLSVSLALINALKIFEVVSIMLLATYFWIDLHEEILCNNYARHQLTKRRDNK